MQRFFVDGAPKGGEFVITNKDQVSQISRVMRLHVGDRIIVFNGSGDDWELEIVTMGKTINTKVISQTRGIGFAKHVTVCLAMIKKDKLELAIQKLVELGVSRIVLMKTARCVKNDISESGLERLKTISIEATEQSEGSELVEIQGPLDFKVACDTFGKQNAYLAFERGGMKQNLDLDTITIFIGPEGGFTQEEVDYAVQQGVQLLSLGRRILRAETAAIGVASKILL